mmetsp:Transcript_18366/g.53039  ORF Transcript_18366/g.53039 Transcript_18366/m.53039 type:complete len:325 (+) Transcript_18366:616-1590(+)
MGVIRLKALQRSGADGNELARVEPRHLGPLEGALEAPCSLGLDEVDECVPLVRHGLRIDRQVEEVEGAREARVRHLLEQHLLRVPVRQVAHHHRRHFPPLFGRPRLRRVRHGGSHATALAHCGHDRFGEVCTQKLLVLVARIGPTLPLELRRGHGEVHQHLLVPAHLRPIHLLLNPRRSRAHAEVSVLALVEGQRLCANAGCELQLQRLWLLLPLGLLATDAAGRAASIWLLFLLVFQEHALLARRRLTLRRLVCLYTASEGEHRLRDLALARRGPHARLETIVLKRVVVHLNERVLHSEDLRMRRGRSELLRRDLSLALAHCD